MRTNDNETLTATGAQIDVLNRSRFRVVVGFEHRSKTLAVSEPDWTPYVNKSSLDYFACCGAGHRVIRTAAAYFVARHINFGLRVFWGWCASVELYDYLFGPEPLEDLDNVASVNANTIFRNDVVRLRPPNRRPNQKSCSCSEEKNQDG